MAKSRRLAGVRAKSRGQQFETLIENSAKSGKWIDLRIPDGCVQKGPYTIIRVKSPFDFILARKVIPFGSRSYTRTLLFDAKSTSENRYYVKKKKNDHQIDHLMRFNRLQDYACGFIVNYDKHGCVVFHSVSAIERAKSEGRGLKHDEGIVIGNKFEIHFDTVFEGEVMVELGAK